MPSIIAISETKLNENNISNISIPGYQFLSKHSPTNAGGVGIYIKGKILNLILIALKLVFLKFQGLSRKISSLDAFIDTLKVILKHFTNSLARNLI